MDYKNILTLHDLANFLRVEIRVIDRVLNRKKIVVERSRCLEGFYSKKYSDKEIVLNEIRIKKKNPKLGYRIVYNVCDFEFKNLLKVLNNYLNEIYMPKDNVHGFVNGRGIRSNASCHLTQNYILKLDLVEFFESITESAVLVNLKRIGFSDYISQVLARLVTFNNKLVQGFNTSPIVANIVAESLDNGLVEYCNNNDLIYSRYADDLYFSSLKLPKKDEITSIINSFGFYVNENKTRLMRRGKKQYVTGLSVFDSSYPRISRKTKRNIRLELYYINKYGIKSHILHKLKHSFTEYKNDRSIRKLIDAQVLHTLNRINGWIVFIRSIEPTLGEKLMKLRINR